ncbi:MAG: GNAT family N-acetyltransferase [Anaerolineales bacterium]|nr:GNAT family N-acetyltransferase [Anaerolineales bacterium]MBP8164561.1 GNAT family N-acetyltransferase [Anaerolineales bacterium]
MDSKPSFENFPLLSTPNLILRDLRLTDLDDLYEYASDPEIDHYTPWDHYKNIEEARENLNDFLEAYEKHGFWAWGIEHRVDKKLIGIININKPGYNRKVEVGYTIARKYWGQGLATEALQVLIQYGFEKLDVARIEAVILPENKASSKVLLKAGMKFEGLLRSYQVWKGKPSDLEMYAIVKA